MVKVGTANGPKVLLRNGGAFFFPFFRLKIIYMKKLALLTTFFLFSFLVKAQKPAYKDLFNTIYKLDSTLFAAFNEKDIPRFVSYLDSSLEFYHDKTGLSDFSYNINAFTRIAKEVPDLKRTLLFETMEVYPIPNYGAVQIAQHQFCHMENGKIDCGVFKFIHVWKKTEAGWKVTRIVSVDH